MDFSLEKYRELLITLKNLGYKIYTIKNWIKEKPERGVIIRHDIDRRVYNALRKSKVEAEEGVNGTYYFRRRGDVFKPAIMQEIESYGNEIGYHYEDLARCGGDYEKAIERFEKNLNEFRKYVRVETISMHGLLLTKFDNRDLWKKYNFKEFGIEGEAYLSIDYRGMYYFSDTGRTWSMSGANLRDNVNSDFTYKIKTTQDLINFIKEAKPEKMCIMTHPERWSSNFLDFAIYYPRDFGVNNLKRMLKIIRKKS